MTARTGIDWAAVRRRLDDADGAARTDEARLEALFRRRAALAARTGRLDAAAAPRTGLAVLTARIGPEWVALPLDQLAGVQPVDRITPVPGWPAAVAGVVNRRGSIEPVLDLGRLLQRGAAAPAAGVRAFALFLRQGPRAFGLRVDELGGLRDIDPAGFPLPGEQSAGPLVAGVGPDGLLLLDLARFDFAALFDGMTVSTDR